MDSQKQEFDQTIKAQRIFPYMDYWVLIILSFCLILICFVAFLTVTPIEQKLLFVIPTLLFAFAIHWMLRWTAICVTISEKGIIRESKTLRCIFTSWEDLHDVYSIIDRKDHHYVLLSSHPIDSEQVVLLWKSALSLVSFLRMRDVCFRISEKEYHQLIQAIRSNPTSEQIVIHNKPHYVV